MHGVFYNAFKESFPIRDYLNISVSGNYQGNGHLKYEQIVENIEHGRGWASNHGLGAFIEFKFKKSILFFSGYSFMSPYYDDDNMRNWRVDCYEDSSYITVDNRINDTTLCPNANGFSSFCNMNDKKMFKLEKNHYCKSVKFVLTGPDSNGVQYFISLSAIDLTGFICVGNDCIFRYKTVNICVNNLSSFKFYIFVILIL